MKLRTKFQDEDFELGEVVDVFISNLLDYKLALTGEASKGGVVTIYYESLQELYDDWEDVPKEEPISSSHENGVESTGKIENIWTGNRRNKTVHIKCNSEKYAKEVFIKLKAWKRLQEKGFKFEAYKPYGAGITFTIAHMDELAEDSKKDLDLLFGGAE